MTWFRKALEDYHTSLADRFSDLASDRGTFPVFAIEHNLEPRALSELKAALAFEIEQDPQLRGAQWAWRYLPLLVAAAETGYRYRGTGTDFWPLLSRELAVETGGDFRTALTRLFELGAKNFQLFRPGNSPWERHFPLIAWPIGNALVPLEIQPQITDALRRAIRAGISFDDTEGIIDYLKELASGHASRRFEHWIGNTDVALEVMRRLLTPDSEGWMSAGILQRIDRDVRQDALSFRAISEARRNNARRISRPKGIPSSRFVVSLSDGLPRDLAIRGPVLSSGLREDVVIGLRIQGDRIRATGSEHSISLRSFLAGGEIELGPFGILPEAPLYRGDNSLYSKQETANILLKNLQPAEASFFLVEPEGHTATAVVPGDALPVGATVIHWMRTDQTGSPEFRRLETDSNTDGEYLRRHGFTLLSKQPVLSVLGIPMPGGTLSYSAHFPLLVSARSHGLTPFLDGEIHPADWLELRGNKWAAFQPSPGEHTLSSPELDDGDSILFEVVEPPDIEPAFISIQPPRATLRDLELGRLEIKISSPVALEQVPVCLRISSGDRQVCIVEETIKRLPHVIAGGSPPLRRLQTQLLERQTLLSGLRRGASQRFRTQNQVETLHVGRDYDDTSLVLGKLMQRLINLVLQIFGGETAVDDAVRFRDTLCTLDFDLRVLFRDFHLDLLGFQALLCLYRFANGGLDARVRVQGAHDHSRDVDVARIGLFQAPLQLLKHLVLQHFALLVQLQAVDLRDLLVDGRPCLANHQTVGGQPDAVDATDSRRRVLHVELRNPFRGHPVVDGNVKITQRQVVGGLWLQIVDVDGDFFGAELLTAGQHRHLEVQPLQLLGMVYLAQGSFYSHVATLDGIRSHVGKQCYRNERTQGGKTGKSSHKQSPVVTIGL